jgi:WD40 repeat protein
MLVCTIAVLLVTIAVGATVSATRLKQANEEGMLKLRHAYLSQARAHRWSGRPGRRFESLEALRQASLIKPGLDLRNEAIAALALVDIGAVRSWEAEDGTFFSLSASYDNYLRAAPSGSVVLHRASDAQPLAALSDVPPLLQWASISPQSRFCVLYSGTNKTRFDLVRWSDTNTLLSLTNLTVRDCEFTFDERLLAVAGTAPMEKPKYWVDVYALSDDMNHSRFPVHTLPSIEFDRSGERMAVFGMNSAEVRIHATSTGLRVDTLPHGHGVHGASWLREDRGLVTACEDGHVYIWDLTVTNRSPVRLRHGSVVSGVHVSQDDRFVASIGWDDQLRLWDLNTRSESLRIPALGFRSFPFAASGRSMARWSAPGRVEVSQIADAREVRLIEASEDSQCQFSPDGRLLLVSDASGLSVREVELGREIGRTTHESFQSAELEWREGSIFTANKSGLRRWAVAFRTEGSSNVLELAAGPLMSDGKELRSLQTDSQGSRIAVCRDGWLEVRDTSSGRLIFSRSRQQHIPSAFMKAAISPDGQWVAGQVWEGNTYLWQVAGQDHGRLLHSNATGLAFSPEGRWFVTGSSLEYTFWDTQTWTVARRIPRPLNAGVHAMAVFDPQGKTAMLRFNDRVFGLFSADDGSELATVEAPVDARLGTGQFSVNGLLVVPCLDRNNVIAWNWPTIRRELGRMGLDWIGPDWPEARSSADVNGLRVRVGTGSFGARDPRCTGKQIDLSSHYNSTLAGFSRFTGDPENDLSALPGGLHRLAGTDFDARGAIQLVEFAKATNCIPIAQFCQRLNFLHAALFAESSGAKPDTVLGEYVVRYADGAVQSIALRNLESVADWWEKDSQRRQLGVHLVRAWHGTSRTSRDKGHETVLYKWVWTNPRPDKAISAICFRRTPQDAIPFLVALTAE